MNGELTIGYVKDSVKDWELNKLLRLRNMIDELILTGLARKRPLTGRVSTQAEDCKLREGD